MTIVISTLVIHVIIIVMTYILSWMVYRYIMHPRYRWSQKGNVCYDDARTFSIIVTIVSFSIIGLFYHDVINVVW
jgi:peptidoglycan/LPS O-acetylase OafA/YrhL